MVMVFQDNKGCLVHEDNTENAGVVVPERLPSFKHVESCRDMYVGPTDESNWVIPGCVLVGAYPAEVDDEAHDNVIRSVLECGVTTFVCLQKEYDHHSTDKNAWKHGKKIRPYIHDAFRIAKASKDNNKLCPADKLNFMHVPIADCDVTSDHIVACLAKSLCWRIIAGEVLYIHCWGGHGRTGTLIAIMLGMLYGIPKAEALKRTQLYHDLRVCPLQVPSPQTFSQRMQVLRILGTVQKDPSIIEQHAKNRDLWRTMQKYGDEFLLPINNTSQLAPLVECGGARSNKKRKLITTGPILKRATPRPIKPPTIQLSTSPTSAPSTIIPPGYRNNNNSRIRSNLGLLR